MGRRSVYKPELEQTVERASGYGLSQEHIAEMLGISVDSLQRHYHDAWKRGRAIANFKIGQVIFDRILAGDTTLGIFWAKVHLGWQEVQKEEREVELKSRVFTFDRRGESDDVVYY